MAPLKSKSTSSREASATPGVGEDVVSKEGRLLGRAVAEEVNGWRLDDGTYVRKSHQGRRWRWGSQVAGAAWCSSPTTPSVRSGSGSTTPSHLVRSGSATPIHLAMSCKSECQDPSGDLDFMEPLPPAEMDCRKLQASQTRKDEHSSRLCGVGSEIIGKDRRSWGIVVADERNGWRLADGRIAKKTMEGRKWLWAFEAPKRRSNQVSTNDDHCHASSNPRARRSESVLESSREDSSDDDQCHASSNPFSVPTELADLIFVGACHWLLLPAVYRAMATCRSWDRAMSARVPFTLPPPQVDAFLQFCLLEVLLRFDESRLPLPMSAVYSEMRAVARRAPLNYTCRERLQELVCCDLGPSCKTQQARFLQELQPQHIDWSADFKNSNFRSLERLAKHFDGEKLIEVTKQTWRKQIHHSPNTRSCVELLMTKLNRAHPLFVDHMAWSNASGSKE